MNRLVYLRTPNKNASDSRGTPVGCVAFSITDDSISYGFSVCSPKDKFDKSRAKEIAKIRLDKKPKVITVDTKDVNQHEIVKKIMEHIDENHSEAAAERNLKDKKYRRSVVAGIASHDWLHKAKLYEDAQKSVADGTKA